MGGYTYNQYVIFLRAIGAARRVWLFSKSPLAVLVSSIPLRHLSLSRISRTGCKYTPHRQRYRADHFKAMSSLCSGMSLRLDSFISSSWKPRDELLRRWMRCSKPRAHGRQAQHQSWPDTQFEILVPT